ncbi:MAG: hypothetical protein A2Y07_01655 [Planctomycetes bacterium GWF2_50_10]|nr:MAG: hypothetical protein A2Y07_01655 [Planctomycetes bacterium GWF2_50_10]
MANVNEKHPAKPEGIGWLTPYLAVRDVEGAMDFYAKAFGFEKSQTMPGPDGKLMHGAMKYKGMDIIMMGPEDETCKAPITSKTSCSINLYVYCDDVDQAFGVAKKGGAKVISEPEDMFWGDRIAQFADMDGYRWTFATHVREMVQQK